MMFDVILQNVQGKITLTPAEIAIFTGLLTVKNCVGGTVNDQSSNASTRARCYS